MGKQNGYDTFLVTDVSTQTLKEESKVVTHLFGRSTDGRKIHKEVEDTVPYCFIEKEEWEEKRVDNLESIVFMVNDGYESFDGKELVQVATYLPKDVRQLRDIFETTHEADIPFTRRCTADYNMTGVVRTPKLETITVDQIQKVDQSDVGNIDPRGLIIDIEVVAPDSFYPEFAEEAPNQVTAITSYDTYDEEYTLFCFDPEMIVSPPEIRPFIEENWSGHEDAERICDVDIVFKRFGNEQNMLKAYIQYINEKEPDYFTGWNYVDFDHEYLFNRMDDLLPYRDLVQISPINRVGGYKTETYVKGIPAIDMMSAYADKLVYGRLKSKSLDYVSKESLGVGKIDGEDNSYDSNRTKFMAYNIVDVQLCVEMNRQFSIIDFWFMLADVCGIPPYDVGSTMKECEGYLFLHREDDEILPDTEEKEMNTISGGFVMPGADGLFPWVGVVDLKSLYPSSIITCNISKETMTTDIDKADVVVPDMPLNYEDVAGDSIKSSDISWNLGEGACVGFNVSDEGILPKYLKQLFNNREELKRLRNEAESDMMYQVYNMRLRAVKFVMNSFFGVRDNPYFRLSADGLGAAITSVSRYVSWMGIQAIESDGFDVKYGDTDSLFISLLESDKADPDGDVEHFVDLLTELEGTINEQLVSAADMCGVPKEHPYLDDGMHGTSQHLWVYESEKLYRRFLQTGAKKRYAGNIVWKEGKFVNDTDVSGFETVKSDSAALTQDVQEEFIQRILDGEEYDELTEFIQTYVTGLQEAQFDLEYIGFPSSINKPLEEYPNMPVKRACQYSNNHLGYDWQSGDDPWLVYVSKTPYNLPDTDVIAVSWQDETIPDGFEINVEKHLSKSVKGPLEAIIDSMDFTWRELKTGMKEQSVIGSGGGDISFEDAPSTESFDFS